MKVDESAAKTTKGVRESQESIHQKDELQIKYQPSTLDSAENRRRELVRITSEEMNRKNTFTDTDFAEYELKIKTDGLKMLKIDSTQP